MFTPINDPTAFIARRSLPHTGRLCRRYAHCTPIFRRTSALSVSVLLRSLSVARRCVAHIPCPPEAVFASASLRRKGLVLLILASMATPGSARRASTSMESPATMEESCLSACQISRTGSLASLTDPASLEARPIDVIVAVPEGGRKRQKPSVARRNIDDRRPFAAVVLRAAERYRVDADLLHALIEVESGYRSDARSPRGAMGLMQLMPVTVEAYGVTDPYDPQENIDAGAQHLRRLLDVFDMAGALAAYNAGQGAVRRFGGIPPYPETRRYVRRILDLVTALEDE